jgi:hypothetical protein
MSALALTELKLGKSQNAVGRLEPAVAQAPHVVWVLFQRFVQQFAPHRQRGLLSGTRRPDLCASADYRVFLRQPFKLAGGVVAPALLIEINCVG